MLNTDQHSPQVKRRMTLEDFIRNNRGINENKLTKKGEDLPGELLVEVFDAIKVQEIKLKDDERDQQSQGAKGSKAPGQVDLEAQLVQTSRNVTLAAKHAGTFQDIGDLGLHDEEMFLSVWDLLLAALSVVHQNSEDQAVCMEAFRGLELSASICSRFGLHDPLDTMVCNLSKLTYLLDPDTDQAIQRFSRSWKAQESFKFIVRLGVRLGDHFRVQAWRSVLDCILVLLSADVVEITLEDEVLGLRDEMLIEDEGDSAQPLPTQPVSSSAVQDLKSPASSAVGRRSRLNSPAVRVGQAEDGTPRSTKGRSSEPSKAEAGSWLKGLGFNLLGLGNQRLRDEKLEAQQAAREALRDCDVKELLTEIRFIQADSLQSVLEALLPDSAGPQSERPEQKTQGAEGKPRIGRQLSGLKPEGRDLGAMEMLIALSLQNRDRIDVIWPTICGPLNEILLAYGQEPEAEVVDGEMVDSSARTRDPLLVRTCTAVLRLGSRMVGLDSLRGELLTTLDLLLELPDSVFSGLGQTLAMNLQMLVKQNLEVLRACSSHTSSQRSAVLSVGGLTSQGEIQRGPADEAQEAEGLRDSLLLRIVSLLERLALNHQTWAMSFQTLSLFVLHKATPNPQAFSQCIQAFSGLASKAESQSTAMKAVDYLYAMHLRLCAANQSTSSEEPAQAKPSAELAEDDAVLVEKWQGMDAHAPQSAGAEDVPASRRKQDSLGLVWVQVLGGMTDAVISRTGDVRDYAMLSLEKAILSSESDSIDPRSKGVVLQCCFEKVVWRLLDKLSDRKVDGPNGVALEKLRVRSWILGCTLLLRQLPALGQQPWFPTIWLQFLVFSEKLLSSDPGPLATEVIPQHLSNTLDVMELDGALGSQNPQLWVETWGRLDRFCPQIKADRLREEASQEEGTEGPNDSSAGLRPDESQTEQSSS